MPARRVSVKVAGEIGRGNRICQMATTKISRKGAKPPSDKMPVSPIGRKPTCEVEQRFPVDFLCGFASLREMVLIHPVGNYRFGIDRNPTLAYMPRLAKR